MKKKYYSVIALSAATSALLTTAPLAVAQEANSNAETNASSVQEDKNQAQDVESSDKVETDENLAEISSKAISLEEAVDVSSKDSLVSGDELPEVKKSKTNEDNYLAHVYVNTGDTVKTVVVRDADASVEKTLEDEDIDVADLRLATGEKVDLSKPLSSDDSLVLFSDRTESSEEVVDLEPSVEIIKDPNLEKGEREVVEKGEKGKAIKTVVSKVNTSLDKEVNKFANAADDIAHTLTKVDESLTITEAPQKRIVKVGTKEVVEAVDNAVAQARSAMDSAASDVQSSVAQGSAALDLLSSVDLSNLDGVRAKVVALAFEQVGKPYVWGAAGPSSFDCSGLIQWIFNDNLGYSVPRVAADQGMASTPIAIEDLEPGDILWTSGHIGIYVGNGEMVHSPQPGDVVKVSDISWFVNSGAQAGRIV